MSRPTQLLLVLVVYALGAKIALSSGASLDVVRLAVGGVALLAASVHYANEYTDHETDALTDRTPFSGGSGALDRTGLPRSLALRAGIAALVVGSVVALVGIVHDVLSLPALGLLTIIAAFGWQLNVGVVDVEPEGEPAVVGGERVLERR